jgi:hypothetical protein
MLSRYCFIVVVSFVFPALRRPRLFKLYTNPPGADRQDPRKVSGDGF